MNKKQRISREEIFESLQDPSDRREVIRWIMHDHNKGSDHIERIFRMAFKDEDWEVQLSTMLACVKLKMPVLIPTIKKLELPKSTNSGLTKEELNMLVGMKNVSLDLLRGTPIPDEPTKLETPEEKKDYLTRLVGRGSMKILNNAFLLYTSLTLPVYPIQDIPARIHASIEKKSNQYFLGDIELKLIPDYRVFIGSSAISYLPVKVSKLPLGTFVSKHPINYNQFILEDSMKTGDEDLVKCSLEEAQEFCSSLTEKYNIQVSIPNAESWEIALRGSNGRFYPWGNAYEPLQFDRPNMWGLKQYGNHGGEWTSNSLKDGRQIIKGADATGRVAPIQADTKDSAHCFRIILSGAV